MVILLFFNKSLYANEVLINKFDQDKLNGVKERITSLISMSFPELEEVDITIESFNSKEYFLKVRPLKSFLFGKSRYKLSISNQLFDGQNSAPGIDGILAHELTHITQYEKMKGKENKIFKLLWSQTKQKSVIKFERETDVEAIMRGYGPQLIDYRLWLYTKIPKDKVEKKKKEYLTPEEIQKIIDLK